MSRGKLILKLIENEKSRMTTYQKRKQGLKKKAEEFATLCGVPTCMIIYGPKLKNQRAVLEEMEVWPKEASNFMEVVNLYRDKGGFSSSSSRGVKAYNLLDFFNERKRKVDGKVNKLRKSNLESKFPSCWDDRLNSLSLDQLRLLLVTFDNNIEVARRRIVTIKGDHDHDQVLIPKNINEVEPISCVNPLVDHHQPPLQVQHCHDFNYPNDNQLSSHYQFGGNAAFGQVLVQPAAAFCLDPTAVFVDNVMINNNQRGMYVCSPMSMQTLQHYHEQCPPLPPSNNIISSSQMMYGSHHHQYHPHFNDFYRDMNEFGIKNERGN